MAWTRDKLIHSYFDVDLEFVWRSLAEDLPPLRRTHRRQNADGPGGTFGSDINPIKIVHTRVFLPQDLVQPSKMYQVICVIGHKIARKTFQLDLSGL